MKYENIELLRIQHELTQQEVADAVGCQREVYRRYEKGTRAYLYIFLNDTSVL